MDRSPPSLSPPSEGSSWVNLLRAVGSAILVGLLLLGLASLAPRIAATHATMDASPLRATDDRLARVYLADTGSQSIRVLNVRSGVSEIARVPLPKGSSIRSIRLDGSGNWLFVDTDAGRFSLATLSLAMQQDRSVVARQSEPMAAPNAN